MADERERGEWVVGREEEVVGSVESSNLVEDAGGRGCRVIAGREERFPQDGWRQGGEGGEGGEGRIDSWGVGGVWVDVRGRWARV